MENIKSWTPIILDLIWKYILIPRPQQPVHMLGSIWRHSPPVQDWLTPQERAAPRGCPRHGVLPVPRRQHSRRTDTEGGHSGGLALVIISSVHLRWVQRIEPPGCFWWTVFENREKLPELSTLKKWHFRGDYTHRFGVEAGGLNLAGFLCPPYPQHILQPRQRYFHTLSSQKYALGLDCCTITLESPLQAEESVPANQKLILGDWIAQWDNTYQAWFFYNIKTGQDKTLFFGL